MRLGLLIPLVCLLPSFAAAGEPDVSPWLHVGDALAEESDLLGLSDGLLVFRRNEGPGTDLNGDGDQDDRVVHVYDLRRGVLHNTGLASPPGPGGDGPFDVAMGADSCLVRVSEAAQGGVDLNGDGDALDTVAHVVGVDGATRNLGLQLTYWAGTDHHLGRDAYWLRANEVTEGADLNGDGAITSAWVILLYTWPSPSVEATSALTTGDVAAGPGFLALRGTEASYDIDFNGDGDTGDGLLGVLDLRTRALQLHPADPSQLTSSLGGLLFIAREDFGEDLNGDGDTQDALPARLDPTSGALTIVPIAVADQARRGRELFVRVVEADQFDQDANGDGDTDDQVVSLVDPQTGDWAPIVSARLYRTSRSGAWMLVSERDEERDLTGDGVITQATVLHVLTLPAGELDNTGLTVLAPLSAPPLADAKGESWLLRTSEAEQHDTDLNADGDADDMVLSHFRPPAGPVNLGLALAGGLSPGPDTWRAVGDGFAVLVSEAQQGADLSGDGDRDDRVLHLIDGTGRVVSTGLAVESLRGAAGPSLAVFLSEVENGRDVDGDGEQRDVGIFYVADVGALSRPGAR